MIFFSIMKHYFLSSFLLLMICLAGCGRRADMEHRGIRNMDWTVSLQDSIELKDDSVSWVGSYFSTSGMLGYLDGKTSVLSFYNWENGKLIFRDLDKGRSRNELPEWGVASAIDDSNIIVIYADNFLYFYDALQRKLENRGFVNFGYSTMGKEKDFESSHQYKLCDKTIYPLDSDHLLFPLACNSSDLDGWYEHSHIWGCYDHKTKRFTQLAGHLPAYYGQHPVPLFERFVSCQVGKGYVTTHLLDSLLYYHDTPDSVAFSFGYEIDKADRNYTCRENDMDDAMTAVKDEGVISLNQSLYYSRSMNVLIRTVITNKATDCVTTIQIYDMGTCDLKAEYRHSGQIDIMYSKGSDIYGVNMNPQDKNYIYRFVITR